MVQRLTKPSPACPSECGADNAAASCKKCKSDVTVSYVPETYEEYESYEAEEPYIEEEEYFKPEQEEYDVTIKVPVEIDVPEEYEDVETYQVPEPSYYTEEIKIPIVTYEECGRTEIKDKEPSPPACSGNGCGLN